MSNYPAIFKLRVDRAQTEIEKLSGMLEIMKSACTQDDNGDYVISEIVGNEALEQMAILSKAVHDECDAAKCALRWHRQKNA